MVLVGCGPCEFASYQHLGPQLSCSCSWRFAVQWRWDTSKQYLVSMLQTALGMLQQDVAHAHVHQGCNRVSISNEIKGCNHDLDPESKAMI